MGGCILTPTKSGWDQGRSMPSCIKEEPPYPGTPRLTLVNVDRERSSQGQSDWSRLMTCAQDGDRDAYRILLTEIEPFIRSIAIGYLSRSADMEDAIQDVLMTVHSIRQTYDPKRPFGPWLVAIAHRRIIDRLRRTMRHWSREVELSAQHETFAAAPANRSVRSRSSSHWWAPSTNCRRINATQSEC